MKVPFTIFLCFLIVSSQMMVEKMPASADNELASAEDVCIAPNSIRIPTGLLLLVRRHKDYGAIKFTEYWTGKTLEDEYATYESYFQGDTTGNFTNQNVQFRRGELSRPRLRGFGRFSFSSGNTDIQCGPIKLLWSGKGWVYFFSSNQDQGEYGIKLAPTNWTDISQVNVFDSRLRWYQYDQNRERERIPIHMLWKDTK